MKEQQVSFTMQVFGSKSELPDDATTLLNAASNALQYAYAPYSGFLASAAILLENGKILTGTNQENASFPAGICAEGTALSAASALYPGVAIQKIAITAHSKNHTVSQPVAPCGICRQKLIEYETRFGTKIEIILAGETGSIYCIESAAHLLPLAFDKDSL